MRKICWINNCMPSGEEQYASLMEEDEIKSVRKFHEGFPGYKATPLRKLDAMAKNLGVRDVFVKDESVRFGLNAFKVLGGSYAMAKYMEHYGKEVDVTFFTATDGNHGRGVAWAAKQLGRKSVVYMPAGTAKARLDSIRKEGAKAQILEMNYDDCVRYAANEAMKTPGGVVIQDTAWEGYEEIPLRIMQGYATMAWEALEQMRQYGVERPTHVFVQAGVGSLAGAIVGYLVRHFPEDPPDFACSIDGRKDCVLKFKYNYGYYFVHKEREGGLL